VVCNTGRRFKMQCLLQQAIAKLIDPSSMEYTTVVNRQ
jgi:hypothetical protein